MTALAPLETLFDISYGTDLSLPGELADLYGGLRFPAHPGRPHIVGNFVATLDGVVSLGVPGQAGGGEISGFNPHDRMVMGLLRAVAGAVIIGAGTLRASSPDHLWAAGYIYPPLADAYCALRTALRMPEPPLNVVVTARGEVDLDRRVFRTGEVPALIVTTPEGAKRIGARPMPPWVQVATADGPGPVTAQEVLAAVQRIRPSELVLVEAGPRLMGDFLAEQRLDELFLTLAPQVAGRDGSLERPGLVAGKRFAPEHPRWGTLVGLKRGGSHLFLRYGFPAAGKPVACLDRWHGRAGVPSVGGVDTNRSAARPAVPICNTPWTKNSPPSAST
jgi:riboflavin biosynthesis pyrimidine reductase